MNLQKITKFKISKYCITNEISIGHHQIKNSSILCSEDGFTKCNTHQIFPLYSIIAQGYCIETLTINISFLFCRSSLFDILRDLQRVECELTQYANEGEEVMPVSDILVRTGAEMSRALKIFQSEADVSGIVN